MNRLFITLGAINGLLAVALGAFAAHGLKARLDAPMLAVFQTGVHYHTTHALALVLIGIIAQTLPTSRPLRRAGWALLTGIVLFCGSLYLMAITGLTWLGAITPLGGTAFLIGWGLLAWAAWHEL
jgi:uncharacterized membrane protein YgdD (TMEM256/DUF423 family)